MATLREIQAQHQQGDLDKAAAGYRSLLRTQPKEASAHYGLGVIALAQNQLKEAVLSLSQALKLNPSDSNCRIHLSDAFARQGQFNQAVRCLKSLVDINPTHPVAHNNLGLYLMQTGNFAPAKHHLKTAIELKPDYAIAYSILADLHCAQRETLLAIPYYEKALKLDPDNIEAACGKDSPRLITLPRSLSGSPRQILPVGHLQRQTMAIDLYLS